MKTPEFAYIDHPEQLEPLIKVCGENQIVAMDTEADSMHHYEHRLCLLQFSIAEKHWLVDPLGGLDLTDLWKVLQDKTLILHGADYDLRMLRKHFAFHPNCIVDTMLAAQLLGENKLGLTNLVEQYFGKKLAKENQKADWTLRPLPEKMQHYAVLDTWYLEELYNKLKAKLEALGRWGWLEESCNQLLEVTNVEPQPPARDPWRIRGSSRLPARTLAILKNAWEWREKKAAKWDRPPFKVLSPQLMLECVRRASILKDPESKLKLPKLPRNFHSSLAAEFTKALLEPLGWEESKYPQPPPPPRKPVASPNADYLEKLKKHRDQVAEGLGIDPTLIANRQQLVHTALIAKENPNITAADAGMMNWQFNLLQPSLVS